MPFRVRSGREEDRIPCNQMAGASPIFEDHTALDHIDRLVRIMGVFAICKMNYI
jgi:hypothetical protein